VTERIPNLERQHHQTVRDYVLCLDEHFDIDSAAMNTYVDFYDLACFGKDEVSEAEYNIFKSALIKIIDRYQTAFCLSLFLFFFSSPFSLVLFLAFISLCFSNKY
jgi:hypothetical protein